MAGVNSLGLASNAGLNMDTINNLRKADEKLIIKPIDKKIADYEQKIESLGEFSKLLLAAQGDVSTIKDEILYLQRTASVIGEGVSAVVEDGVEPQNITLKVEQLAQEHIVQSDPFKSKNSSVANEDTKLEIKVGKAVYEFDVKAGLQLRDLVGDINQRAGADLNASILQTGPEEFRMVLKAVQTGENTHIEMTQGQPERTEPKTTTVEVPKPVKKDPETGQDLPIEYETLEVVENVTLPATNLSTNLYNELQQPQNSKFVYNGAEITRESNKIDDMVVGLEFTLEEVTGENKRVNIKIGQDSLKIVDAMQSFVNNYNALMAEVDNMTKYDPDKNEQGIFLGENMINSVRSSINSIIRSVNLDGKSLANLGIGFNQDGVMEFDSFTFENAVVNDPKGTQEVLQGKKETLNGKDLMEDGIFFKLYEVLDDLVNSADGSIPNFEKSLEAQLKRTRDEKKNATERLDSRYEQMQNQFAAADSAIGKMQKGFESVNMQIKQSQASK